MVGRVSVLSVCAVLCLSAAAACGSSDSSDSSGSGGGGTTLPLAGAPGVTIGRIAIFQGPQRVLVRQGEKVEGDVPLVAGRDAVMRVFYQTSGEYDGGPVTSQLKLGGETIEVTGPLAAGSKDGDLSSTVNFKIPGELLSGDVQWSVLLGQSVPSVVANSAARWPVDGSLDTTPVIGKKNTFRMIIVPYRYNADNSGRLPNTSEEQIAKFRERFLGMYPVSDVEISVHAPVDWSNQLSPDGTGWQGVGLNLYGIRNNEGIPDDTYLYGMFNPSDSLRSYCGLGGCLLGVTLLNNNPPDTGDVNLRLALGVGFDEVAPDTSVHEVGHAHGRNHVDCVPPGNTIDGVDTAYPHDPKTIGVLSYDIATDQVKLPAEWSDIMGYCRNQWISDYTYNAIYRRSQLVNTALFASAGPVEYDVLSVDGQGNVNLASEPLKRSRPLAGENITIHSDGSELSGDYYHWDHLPGGLLFVPKGELGQSASFQVDGVSYTLEN